MRRKKILVATSITVVSLILLLSVITIVVAKTASANKPNLRLPWLYGSHGLSGYSYNCGDHNTTWDQYALDFDLPFGTPVTAVADGNVHFVRDNGNGYGNNIWVSHGNGYVSVYAHLGDNSSNTGFATLNEGQFVKQGTIIGYSGNSGHSNGRHLHFSLRSNFDGNPKDLFKATAVIPEPMSGYSDFSHYGNTYDLFEHRQDQNGAVCVFRVRPQGYNPGPGGYWIGPTPSDQQKILPNTDVKVGFQAHDNSNQGIIRVDFTRSIDNGKTWNKYSPIATTLDKKSGDTQYFWHFPMTWDPVLISVDVYSKNGSYQLAPNGIRGFCNLVSGQCPTNDYAYWDGEPSIGFGGGGGNTERVMLCSDPNYGGTCAPFGAGSVNDLSQYGLGGNVSSILVPNTYTLFMFDQKNQQGTRSSWNENVPDLKTKNWDNMAKSIKVEPKLDTSCTVANNVDGIVLYHDVNYGTNGGCRLATDSINDLGAMNFTRISSLRFSGTFINHKKVTLYKDANYGLVCGIYTTDKSDLRECAQQDIVSIKIEDYNQPQQANNIASSAILDPSNAGNAVDGDLNTEWVGSNKQSLTLTFPSTQSIQKIVVFDRFQNHPDNNQINKVQIDFGDGTKTPEVDMESGGRRCAAISFPVKSAKKVIVQPTDASGSNGFREVFVYDNSANGTDNPCDNATTVSLIGTPVAQPEQQSNPSQDSSNNQFVSNPTPTPTPIPTSTPTAVPTENATNYHPTQTADVEAESQELTGPAYIENCGGCSGGKFVFNIGSDGSGGQTLGTVKVSIAMKYAGDYQLTIYYCSEQDMDGQITVANGTSYPMHYPSAGTVCWNGGSPAKITTTIHLNGQGDLITFSIPNPPTSGEARFGIDKFTFVG